MQLRVPAPMIKSAGTQLQDAQYVLTYCNSWFYGSLVSIGEKSTLLSTVVSTTIPLLARMYKHSTSSYMDDREI